MSWTAVVLAGSRPGRDTFAEQFGTALKPLIPVGGEPMVRRPVRALLQSGGVGKILVVSQSPDRIAAVLPEDARIEFRKSAGSIAETIERIVLDRSTAFPLIVTTADHALLDAQMIAEFTAAAQGADLAIGVVERRPLLARLPQTQRTWLAFRGGAYSGANLFALGSIKTLAAIEQWRAVEQDRKKGWRVLSALGPALLLGALLRVRTLDQSVAATGRKLGLTARAIVLSDPLAAVDVDKPDDHALVEAILAGRA
ncbi:nucleotidyltransferase family protein [Sphingomonas segetis]|jgi:GTP:adenosylcobinamide-phosphate guanylyltransferase|uniref:nucleotidyltransferase family protein n=1 Tax=Sphingomonas segetis TaxID=1104779 RepID=UPI0012D2FB54|nr:nucleotidyltransferase family protein [Sphingomonas segetis]